MSRMSDMMIEIEELIVAGELSNEAIAETLKVPLDWVETVEENLANSGYDESMDGDHASALASAGWGTDEDYGSYDEF